MKIPVYTLNLFRKETTEYFSPTNKGKRKYIKFKEKCVSSLN